ncbi:MAG: selenocysteine-specific translation elongation factor [Dehalococcoidales bacterium]|nr:selenocysteine-specific translation elongation factor [Dehalococcoidales bacterium]
MFVMGTAGHIDHGKSALVQALTGIDPDRLKEEKERGMTIDLGFAWLKLPGGKEVGIVDVPGHERFIKNMLAGVGGIDLALLVVAANEGVMPQTREHLAILDLLKVRRGIVVITKKDLVDDDLLSLVKMEIAELLAPTTLAQAPVVAVSAITGDGLPELREIIGKLLETTEPRKDLGKPRLPIDRIFTITGAGTVVTGTLIDGSLSLGQEVEIVPSGLKSRLRGLQTHKAKVESAQPGTRVAANLVGVSIEQLKRGDVLTRPGWLKPTSMLTVKLQLLSYLPRPLRHGTSISFHCGAAEAIAKVRLLQAETLKPGESAWGQIMLEESVAVVGGDRFIIRSPVETLGGGEIVEAHAARLRRFRPEIFQSLEARQAGTAEESVMALLETKQPMLLSALLAQSHLPEEEARALIQALIAAGRIITIGTEEQRILLTANGWNNLAKRVVSWLQDYHQKFPARSGMPRVELASKLKMGDYSILALNKLSEQRLIAEEVSVMRVPTHQPKLTSAQQAKMDAFLKALAQQPYAPPSELIPESDLVNLLVSQRKAVKVSDNIIFSTAAYDEMVAKIKAHIKEHGKVTLGEVRDLFQTSRKYAQALLEYLDGQKVTRRTGDDRGLYQ